MEQELPERKVSRLNAQWEAAQNARNWAEAERVLQRLIPLLPRDNFLAGMYRLYLCDYKFYRGELDRAKAGYLKALRGGCVLEGAVCTRLMRIAAERGDFVSSLHWVERYARAQDSVCGGDIEGRQIEAHKFRTILRAVMGTSPEVSLHRIISGHFRTLPPRYSAMSRSDQRESAAQEARLILAEHLLRQKRIQESKTLFRELVNRAPKEWRFCNEPFLMAEFHLKRLG